MSSDKLVEAIDEANRRIAAMVDDLCVNGTSIERFTFVAETAVRLLAAGWSTHGPGKSPQRIRDAFDCAEAAWAELCSRFSEDADEGGAE